MILCTAVTPEHLADCWHRLHKGADKPTGMFKLLLAPRSLSYAVVPTFPCLKEKLITVYDWMSSIASSSNYDFDFILVMGDDGHEEEEDSLVGNLFVSEIYVEKKWMIGSYEQNLLCSNMSSVFFIYIFVTSLLSTFSQFLFPML